MNIFGPWDDPIASGTMMATDGKGNLDSFNCMTVLTAQTFKGLEQPLIHKMLFQSQR